MDTVFYYRSASKLSLPSTSSSTPLASKTVESSDTKSEKNLQRKVSGVSEKSNKLQGESKKVDVLPGVVLPKPAEVGAECTLTGPAVCINSEAVSTSGLVESNPDKKHENGVMKCGNVIIGFAPVKKKKPYYAVLSKRAFELHDSEKAFKKGTTAKHIVDLATAFNVHLDHYDPKLKRCLCLMGPDETICIKCESIENAVEWYDTIILSMIPSRQLRLGRPCSVHEIFEAVYDVEVVPHMKNAEKYKKQRREAGYTNICETMKDLSGTKRLCFYSHTVILANRRIEPTTVGCPDSGFPPFQADCIVEFPRPLIAYFGCHERYFFLRLGRGIAIGGTELLVQCDCPEVASAIHKKMSLIIERESGRRNHMSIPSGLLHRAHRDRSHTLQDGTKRLDHPRGSIHSLGGLLTEGTRRPSNTIKMVKEEPGLAEALRALRYPKKLSQQSDVDCSELARKFSTNKLDNQDTISERALHVRSMTASTSSLGRRKGILKSPSIYSTVVTTEEGCGPKKIIMKSKNSDVVPNYVTHKSFSHMELPPCSNDETYSKMDPSDWNYKPPQLHLPNHKQKEEKEKYNLEEVRSYFSDSSDSCYSSMANNSQLGNLHRNNLSTLNAPRANSFGGRIHKSDNSNNKISTTTKKLVPKTKDSQTTLAIEPAKDDMNMLSLPVEDPRKRAFSLGSKNFFNFMGLNEFRRLVKKPKSVAGRPASPNHTSTSGMSLNSSTASPSSCSTNFLASFDVSDESRIRSGSFGSGRSSPFGRHAYPIPAPPSRETEHHMEIDFSSLSKGALAISNSVESPVRNSPFGGGNANPNHRKDKEEFSVLSIYKEPKEDMRCMRPSEIVIAQHRQMNPDGEYMFSDPFAKFYPVNKHEESRRSAKYESSYEKQSRREDEKHGHHPKTSVCGSIREEKEDADSSADYDDRSSDTKTVVASISPNEHPPLARPKSPQPRPASPLFLSSSESTNTDSTFLTNKPGFRRFWQSKT